MEQEYYDKLYKYADRDDLLDLDKKFLSIVIASQVDILYDQYDEDNELLIKFDKLYQEKYKSTYENIDINLFLPPLRRDEDYFPEYYFFYIYCHCIDSFNSITHLNVKSIVLDYLDECKGDYNQYYEESITNCLSHFRLKYSQFLE